MARAPSRPHVFFPRSAPLLVQAPEMADPQVGRTRSGDNLQRPLHGCPCMPTLQEQFGAIDIYLFDQLLRGNVSKGMTIFDAGCGTGRNIVYLLREGYEV